MRYEFHEQLSAVDAVQYMLANFHGAFKPTGLERRFPNAVTREAVVASEYHKWSDVLTPEYEVTVPFIRGMVGPVDYEPGHMRNAQRDVFRPMGALPMSQGTRMHQAAMYLAYESPYAKMGGNVSDYEREAAVVLERFKGVPPLVEDGPSGPTVSQRALSTRQQRSPATNLTNLHVLVFSRKEGKLVRLTLPFWLLRMAPDGRMDINVDTVDLDKVRLSIEDVERAGPGPLFLRKNGESRVLVWTE